MGQRRNWELRRSISAASLQNKARILHHFKMSGIYYALLHAGNWQFHIISLPIIMYSLIIFQLKDVGLDLSFVLDKLFFADIVQAIEEHASFLNDIIHGFLDAEKFGRCSPPSDHVHQWKADFGKSNYLEVFMQ